MIIEDNTEKKPSSMDHTYEKPAGKNGREKRIVEKSAKKETSPLTYHL
jgi:hypothetical protein